MTTPRIAIINDQPRSSGTGNYAWHLAERLGPSGQDIADHVFLDYPGHRIVKDPGTAHESLVARIGGIPLLDNRPWFWRRCLRQLPGYDICHFTSQNMSFLCGSNPAQSVVTCLDIIPVIEPEGMFDRYWRSYLYSGLRRAGRIIAISQATKRDVVRHFGIPEGRIDVVYLGVDPDYRPRDKREARDALGLPQDKKIVLHVGTTAKRKRIPLLLEAFARSRAQDAILVRIGRAPREHRDLARRLGITDRVLFLENIAGDKLPLYYNAADLLVFPSSQEGFGLPLLEAMASGVPVVAADLTSIPEVVGDAGLLVSSDDPTQWAAAIDAVLSAPEKQTELSAKGIDRTKQFTWERTAKATLAIYDILN